MLLSDFGVSRGAASSQAGIMTMLPQLLLEEFTPEVEAAWARLLPVAMKAFKSGLELWKAQQPSDRIPSNDLLLTVRLFCHLFLNILGYTVYTDPDLYHCVEHGDVDLQAGAMHDAALTGCAPAEFRVVGEYSKSAVAAATARH